jgi:hypothetical protein
MYYHSFALHAHTVLIALKISAGSAQTYKRKWLLVFSELIYVLH